MNQMLYGSPNPPCPTYIRCHYCEGSGEIYINKDTEKEVSYKEWMQLPMKERGFEVCPRCEGKGEIIEEED